MEVIKKIIGYLSLGKPRDPDAPDSINLRFMHGINRISIFMFLAALIFLIGRAIVRAL